MTKKLFLYKDTAFKLKQLGFNYTCIASYTEESISFGVTENTSTDYKETGAILYQQALDWLETMNLFLKLSPSVDDEGVIKWEYILQSFKNPTSIFEVYRFGFLSKYNAINNAIDKAIQILNNEEIQNEETILY